MFVISRDYVLRRDYVSRNVAAMRTTELLSAKEVAARLGVGVRKVQRLLQSGQIEAQKLPGDTGSYVITESAVAAYERAQEKQAS